MVKAFSGLTLSLLGRKSIGVSSRLTSTLDVDAELGLTTCERSGGPDHTSLCEGAFVDCLVPDNRFGVGVQAERGVEQKCETPRTFRSAIGQTGIFLMGTQSDTSQHLEPNSSAKMQEKKVRATVNIVFREEELPFASCPCKKTVNESERSRAAS